MNIFTCDICQNTKWYDGIGTGYGNFNNQKVCYDCCANMDKKAIEESSRFTFYLTQENGKSFVGNWPGTLKFKVDYLRKGNHIAGIRYDIWFTDHKGKRWHGITYGDNTQICHCKRIKNEIKRTSKGI